MSDVTSPDGTTIKASSRTQVQAMYLLAVGCFVILGGIAWARLNIPGAEKSETILTMIAQGLVGVLITIGNYFFGSTFRSANAPPPQQ